VAATASPRHKQILAERFDIELDDWEPRYNIAPTQAVPVIRQHPAEPKRLCSAMRWGLTPYCSIAEHREAEWGFGLGAEEVGRSRQANLCAR